MDLVVCRFGTAAGEESICMFPGRASVLVGARSASDIISPGGLDELVDDQSMIAAGRHRMGEEWEDWVE